MADLELSRRTLSPEPQLYSHRTWTRQGYMQPTLEERRGARRSHDRSARSPPHSDRDPSLLLRMDLGAPYPSKSGPTNHGPSGRRSSTSTKSPSRRRAPERTKKISSGTSRPLTLGSHHVEPLPGHAAEARRGSLFKSGVTHHGTTNDVDIRTSNRLDKRDLKSLSRSGRRYPSPESSISDRSPSSRHFNGNGHRTVVRPTEERGQRNSDVLESAWSHLPLKDRIAPLIVQNAHLRSNYDEYEMNDDQDPDTPLLDTRNVDAVLTPDVCDSIAESLCVSAMQLSGADALQPPQSHPSMYTTENINPPTTNPPAEATSRPTIHNLHPSRNSIATPRSMPSLPPESPVPQTSHDHPPVFQQIMYDKRDQKESMLVDPASSSSSFRAEQYYSTPSVPIHGQQDAIPIPFFPTYFNQVPFQQTLDISQPNDTARNHHYGSHRNDGLEFSQINQPDSPNSRPRKRLRSHSPQAPISSQYHQDNAGSRGRVRYSHSPPPYPYGRSPTSPTSIPYRRYSQFSPYASRRSRSPQSQSPRHHEASYSNGYHRQPTSIHHETSPYRSPPKLQPDHKYAYSHGAKKDSLDASTSTYEKYSNSSSKAFKEPHPIVGYSERYKQERSKKEGEQRVDRRRDSNSWEDNRGRRHSKSYGGRKIAGRNLELPQKPASIMDPSTLLPTPPTSAASINDRMPTAPQQSEELDKDTNSAKSVGNSARMSVDAPTGLVSQEEAPTSGVVELAATITDTKKTEAPPWNPFNNIPGLWFLKEGSAEPDILEHSLEVTQDIALKWDLPLLNDVEESVPKESKSHLKLKRNFLPRASWKLKCVPTEHMDAVRQILNNPTTAKDLVHELSQLKSQWPAEGKLIVEVNPDHALGKTFYAKHLDPMIPSVELKYYLHEGFNLVRFIQLGDMSKHAFILYAIPTELPMTDGALPQHGQELDYELSLDNLQCMLQKSKADNGATSKTPLFRARSAKVSISLTGDRTGGNDSK